MWHLGSCWHLKLTRKSKVEEQKGATTHLGGAHALGAHQLRAAQPDHHLQEAGVGGKGWSLAGLLAGWLAVGCLAEATTLLNEALSHHSHLHEEANHKDGGPPTIKP